MNEVIFRIHVYICVLLGEITNKWFDFLQGFLVPIAYTLLNHGSWQLVDYNIPLIVIILSYR